MRGVRVRTRPFSTTRRSGHEVCISLIYNRWGPGGLGGFKKKKKGGRWSSSLEKVCPGGLCVRVMDFVPPKGRGSTVSPWSTSFLKCLWGKPIRLRDGDEKSSGRPSPDFEGALTKANKRNRKQGASVGPKAEIGDPQHNKKRREDNTELGKGRKMERRAFGLYGSWHVVEKGPCRRRLRGRHEKADGSPGSKKSCQPNPS